MVEYSFQEGLALEVGQGRLRLREGEVRWEAWRRIELVTKQEGVKGKMEVPACSMAVK